MLHDLFLLSEYFEPPQSLTTEKELVTSYGSQALARALSEGYLRQYSVPCVDGACKNYYMLSEQGQVFVRNAYQKQT